MMNGKGWNTKKRSTKIWEWKLKSSGSTSDVPSVFLHFSKNKSDHSIRGSLFGSSDCLRRCVAWIGLWRVDTSVCVYVCACARRWYVCLGWLSVRRTSLWNQRKYYHFVPPLRCSHCFHENPRNTGVNQSSVFLFDLSVPRKEKVRFIDISLRRSFSFPTLHCHKSGNETNSIKL